MYGVVAPDPSVYKSEIADIRPNPANYGAGKAAIIQLTKYIACFYGDKGIRANCICPGAFPNENQDAAFITRLAAKTPLRRVGRPDDLKGATVLLASDASSYITGQNYIVDGGWTAW
jgi:gluconate 5-dehydrogenase